MAQVIQLSYQPAFDPLHAVFRLTRLSQIVATTGPLPKDTVRILDFFLLFPFRISEMRMKRDHTGFRRIAKRFASSKPYGDQPEGRVLLERMEVMQMAALQTLASKGFIDATELSRDRVKATVAEFPAQYRARIEEKNLQEADLISFLSILAADYPLLGEDGLKARSRLMEYRYDAI
jgi:hypothetical protein